MRRVSRSRSMFKLLAMVIVLTMFVTTLFAATPTPIPLSGLEAKFMVDSSKVVQEGTTALTAEAQSLFGVTSSTNMIVAYIDNDSKLFNNDGWSNRLRKKENKSNYELQYKKRYPVVNGDIDAALKLAAADGLTADLTGYTAEVDWGFDKMTLSIATETKVKTTTGLFLPEQNVGVNMVKANSPAEQSAYTYDGARYYGPVTFTRHVGTFMGTEIDIEVWPIVSADGTGVDTITEVSFKGTTLEEVTTVREALRDFLSQQGILLEQDSLKTQLILERY